jgi:hypothetical protein
VFAKRKKAPALGDMPGCVCKEKESTRTGRENVAVVGGAMLVCAMWGYLGSMLTHVGLSLGHLATILDHVGLSLDHLRPCWAV